VYFHLATATLLHGAVVLRMCRSLSSHASGCIKLLRSSTQEKLPYGYRPRPHGKSDLLFIVFLSAAGGQLVLSFIVSVGWCCDSVAMAFLWLGLVLLFCLFTELESDTV